MSFVQVFRILWARRWIVIGATLACFIAALAAGKLLPERYEAKTRIMMDLAQPDPVTGQGIASGFIRAYTRTQTELIKDYRVTGAVVDALGWASSPQLIAQYNASGVSGTMDFRRWLAQLVSANTTARSIDASNILEITYASSNPQSARAIADAIRDAYLAQNVAFKRETASKSADWFDRQVLRARDLLAAAESRKTAFEKRNKVVLQDDQSDTETTRLRALASAVAGAPATTAAAAAGANPSAAQLAMIDARIQLALQQLGPNHPDVIALREQRTAVARAGAIERAASAPAPSGPSGPSLSSQVSAQEARVLAQRSKVEEARRLQTDVAVLRDQYAKTAAKAADYRQQAQSTDSGLTPLGSAIAPDDPVFPNMTLIVFGSLAAGLALGVLVALVTEMLSRRVRGVEDLSNVGVPVLIVLNGWNERDAKPGLMQRLRLRAPEPA